MRHHWDIARYPKLVYVETTNFCNARCTFCLYDRMERPVSWMSQETFRAIADKVKAANLKIGAMFCFGEPLADRDIFNKIRYGRSINVMTPYLGLNTNASMLTPHKFDDILETCTNITLSFVTTGEDFERLTGLIWQQCYDNALAFIAYRNKHKPAFQIEIGCNDVTGHDRRRVQAAFDGHRVQWARDAEIHWGGKTITGVIDRSIMYRNWVCDGYKGALQVKPNGDCCFCAYDVIRSETKFANILTDTWEEIETGFKTLWRRPSSLCLRCDFWWNYHQMVAGGWQRGPHIDSSWQQAYGAAMHEFWQEQHETGAKRYLTGSRLSGVLKFHQLSDRLIRGHHVLNIGVGTGACTRDLKRLTGAVSVLDIVESAVTSVADVTECGYTEPEALPDKTFEFALCHLVAQHMTDIDLYGLLKHAIRSLNSVGLLSIQYAAPPGPEVYAEDIGRQKRGLVRRTAEHFERLVTAAGGEVVKRVPPRRHDPTKATDDNVWHCCHIRRRDDHI